MINWTISSLKLFHYIGFSYWELHFPAMVLGSEIRWGGLPGLTKHICPFMRNRSGLVPLGRQSYARLHLLDTRAIGKSRITCSSNHTSCILRIHPLVQFYLPKWIHRLCRNCSRKWTDYFNRTWSSIFWSHTFRRCGWSTVTVCCACILEAYLPMGTSKPIWKKISQLHKMKYCLHLECGNIIFFSITRQPGLLQRSLMKRSTPWTVQCLLTCSSITYSSWSKSFILNSIPNRIQIYWAFRLPIPSHLK